jgi:hypothetical protein
MNDPLIRGLASNGKVKSAATRGPGVSWLGSAPRAGVFSGFQYLTVPLGTSASGFAAEVAAEENIATLDYLEDLYRDWDDGARGAGGAAGRIDAEFVRVRAELGDLPGITADPPRLRAMLAHLTRILHPGTLNDCFFNAATAACATAAGHARQPLPMLNTCMRCPNARRSAVHLPRLAAARGQALELQAVCDAAGPVPAPQHAAITGYISDLTQLIDQISTAPADQEEQR